MRTIKIDVYTFDELSEEAKKTAIDNFNYDAEYFWGNDALKTIEIALAHFGASLSDYSIDWLNAAHSHFSIDMNEEIGELRYIALKKHIYKSGMLQYYCKYDKKLKNTLDGNCPFTGYCADEDFLDEIREFIKNPYNISFKNLLFDCVERVLKTAQNDFEEQRTEEYLSDHFDANGYEFTVDGERVK